MRAKVAYLCSADTYPGEFDRRSDAWEHDLTIGMLGMGLHRLERDIVPVRWDAPGVNWRNFEAAIIGTTWDYAERCDEFVATLANIAQQTKVLNSAKLVAWNARKTYLQDLANKGCPTLPTLWLDSPHEPACRAAFDQFGCDSLVIKPQIGAGAWRQVKLQRDEAWPESVALPPGPCMVQPFFAAVQSEGELSLLFFNRQFSHAVRKRAANGDYRIQSSYGGIDEPYAPNASDLATAEQVLAAVEGDVLYARVDLLRGDDGLLRLIELELIEPYLYPVHAPQMGRVFADAYRALML
jgi:hypothetical protein